MNTDLDPIDERPLIGLQRESWSIAPWFILRMAGFPVELMDRLRFDATHRAIEALDDPAANPQRVSEIEAMFQAELDAHIQRLRTIASEPAFREAVFLSNPASYPLIERWIDGDTRSPSKLRQGVLTVMLYLQRFCMKNDTASFFGPFYWGRFDPDSRSNIRLAFGAGPHVRRTTFFSHWAAHTLARWASQWPNAARAIRPRRVPTMALTDGLAHGLRPTNGRWQHVATAVELPSYGADLLTLIDGEYTLETILTEGCRRWGVARSDLQATIERLVAAGLIHAQIEIPSGPTQPLEDLSAELRHAEVHEALPVIERFLALKQAFATADLEARKRLLVRLGELFEQTTGTSATRGAGKHYADRSLLYEDGVRNLAEFTLGGQLLRDVAQLDTLWDLLWIVHDRDRQLTQQTIGEWFRQRFPNRSAVPFLTYAEAFLEDAPTLQTHFEENARVLHELLHAIFNGLIRPEAAARPVVRRTLDDIRQLIAQLGGRSSSGAVVNPDFMVTAPSLEALNRGEYKLVIGEVHTAVDLLTHTPLTYGLPDVEREALRLFVSERYADLAAPDEFIVDVIRLHLRKTSAQLALEAPHLEAQGRSPKPRRDVAALSDTEVRLQDGTLRLYVPAWRRYIRLSSMRVPNGNAEQTNLLRPFALTEQEGVIPMPPTTNYHPRVEVGNVVLLRRTWRIHYHDWRYEPPADQRGWSVELFIHAARLRQALDLPERIFAKIAGETKPIFVDFANYFLIHAFFKLWQKHRGVAVLSEACPDSADAWLHDERGHYSCEFRVGFYRRQRK